MNEDEDVPGRGFWGRCGELRKKEGCNIRRGDWGGTWRMIERETRTEVDRPGGEGANKKEGTDEGL